MKITNTEFAPTYSIKDLTLEEYLALREACFYYWGSEDVNAYRNPAQIIAGKFYDSDRDMEVIHEEHGEVRTGTAHS